MVRVHRSTDGEIHTVTMKARVRRSAYLLAALLLLAFPSVAQANVGTALMWAGIIHLFFGNLVIGAIEGLLLAKVFRRSVLKCIALMIPANYFSAWLGVHYLAPAIGDALPMDLQNAWPLLGLMVLVTWLLTLLLEFPFVAFAFWRDPSWRGKSLKGSFLVQTVSYAALFGWFWLASGTSLYTRTEVVDISSMSLPESVLVSFISADDGDVYVGSLREQGWEKLADLDSSHRNDRLVIQPSSEVAGSWDLLARLQTDESRAGEVVTVQERFAAYGVRSVRDQNADPAEYEGTWSNFGPVPRLEEAEASSWEFRSGFWTVNGLHGKEANTGERVWIALDTPFMGWSIRNATHLPTDIVLFQLGDDQVCVYDPETKRIALLVRGWGPVAVMKSDESKTPADGN